MKIMPAATGTEKYKEGPRARPVKEKWRKKKGRKKKVHVSIRLWRRK